MDSSIIVPPLLPPLLDILKTENVLPLARMAASETETKYNTLNPGISAGALISILE